MRESVSETDDTTASVTLHLVNYPPDCGEAVVRQIGFGIQPLILIEPDLDFDVDVDENTLALNLTASELGEIDAIIDVLEVTLKALKSYTPDET